MDGRQRPWTAGSSEPGRADPVPPGLPAAEDAFIRVRMRGFEGGAAVRQGSWVTSPPPAEWPEAAGTGNGHGGRQTSAPAPRAGQPAPRLLPARYPPGNAVCAILGKPMAFLPGPSRSPADGPGSAAAFPGGAAGAPLFALRQAFRPNRRFHKYLRKPERRGAARGAGRWLRLSDVCAAPSRGEGEPKHGDEEAARLRETGERSVPQPAGAPGSPPVPPGGQGLGHRRGTRGARTCGPRGRGDAASAPENPVR